MRIKTGLFIATIFITAFCFGQAALSTDTSVIVIPHWKKGETHKVKLTSTTILSDNGREAKYPSTFEAAFTVTEKDTTGYIVEWVYTKCNLAPGDVTIENHILNGLVNTKLQCKFSLTGRFQELANVDEVKAVTDKVVDDLISKSSNNPTMNVQFVAAKQLLTTKQNLEVVLLKQIKFYNFSFGFKYRLNFVQTNKLKMPNILGGPPYDAVEKVELKKLDNTNTVCVIETNKTVDQELLKSSLTEYVQKAAAQAGKTLGGSFGTENLEYSEHTSQQIEFKKGIIEKASFARVANIGIQNRTVIIEIESAE